MRVILFFLRDFIWRVILFKPCVFLFLLASDTMDFASILFLLMHVTMMSWRLMIVGPLKQILIVLLQVQRTATQMNLELLQTRLLNNVLSQFLNQLLYQFLNKLVKQLLFKFPKKFLNLLLNQFLNKFLNLLQCPSVFLLLLSSGIGCSL